MSYLTKDQILNALDQSYVDVDVPEWGGKVRLRALSAKQKDQFECDAYRRQKLNKPFIDRAGIVALCAVDESGELVFSPGDVKKLEQKSARAMDRVFQEACKLNGLFAAEEELAKNSSDDQDDDSLTD